MCNKSLICRVLFASGAITFYEGNNMLSALLLRGLYIYRLIHGLFHIALSYLHISTRPWYRHRGLYPEGRYQSRADDKGNMKKAMY
jgi:hypothetical protein